MKSNKTIQSQITVKHKWNQSDLNSKTELILYSQERSILPSKTTRQILKINQAADP